MSTLKQELTDAMKAAMKGGDKKRLGVIRLAQAAIKQIEVDTREELNDEQVLAVLDKMVKQRRDSAKQYTEAGRPELAEQEDYEITVLQDYLPEALSDEEIEALIKSAIADTGASSMQDMGKVMGKLKAQVQGRADMGAVSGKIKALLTA
ncbi:MAG: GatB/YqeY domain-containing protein [Gammaproteobacteria bacterium]|nr:GatB/YqeY domain-containing protein [Gammaproteobacteria bacterium]